MNQIKKEHQGYCGHKKVACLVLFILYAFVSSSQIQETKYVNFGVIKLWERETNVYQSNSTPTIEPIEIKRKGVEDYIVKNGYKFLGKDIRNKTEQSGAKLGEPERFFYDHTVYIYTNPQKKKSIEIVVIHTHSLYLKTKQIGMDFYYLRVNTNVVNSTPQANI